MRILAALLALALFALITEPASAQSCQSLWNQRNAIYARQGYCFETERGRAAFGNAGCRYGEGNVPLSSRQRARINEIRRMERALGCS